MKMEFHNGTSGRFNPFPLPAGISIELRSRPWPSGCVGGRSGRPRGSLEALHGSPDSSEWEEAPVLSVNYDFSVNLTTFALQPARPRRDDASTPHPDDMGLSLSVPGPIQGVVSLGIV